MTGKHQGNVLLTLSLITILLFGVPWTDAAWAQQSSARAQAELRKRPKAAPPAQASPVKLLPDATPVAADPDSALGRELEACDKAEAVEPVSLSGAKGEIKLDRCYRGRNRLLCSFRALSTEAKFLLENYSEIVNASYPELGSIDDVCKIEPDRIVTDLRNAADFSERFKTLKSQFDARVNCATRVQQNLADVTLPDMTQAPAMLKSMIDSMQGDISGVSAPQAQLVEFGERLNSAQKALLTIQKIHQVMCGKQTAATASQEPAPTQSLPPSDSSSLPSRSSNTETTDESGTPPEHSPEHSKPSGSSSQNETQSRRASLLPLNADKYFVVVDPVDSCVGIEIEPGSSYLTLGNKSGYSTLAAAKKALNATKAICKRAVE
jgi:hypothetical protein